MPKRSAPCFERAKSTQSDGCRGDAQRPRPQLSRNNAEGSVGKRERLGQCSSVAAEKVKCHQSSPDVSTYAYE